MTNLRVLKPSRKAPQSGDVFVLQPSGREFLLGRVIATDARWTLADDASRAILIYIYRVKVRDKNLPPLDDLRPADLLIPPALTNRLPWSRGYFETLVNVPLTPLDVLPRHCFLSASRGRYFDEHGVELLGPIEPCGDHGLHSFRTLDDQISDALGMSRA